MPTIELLQNQPSPQCDHLNVYTGAVLARAEAGSETEARQTAETEAKNKAKAMLDDIKNDYRCPTGCNQGAWGGTIQPVATTAYCHPDTANNRWVAYATSDWKATLPCEGTATNAALNLAAQAKELRYSSSGNAEPPCNKTSVYSGCVIAHAIGTDATTAKTNATTKALELALRLLDEDKRRKCRAACRPGVPSASDPQNLTVEEILKADIRHATGTPPISYVRVAWNATIWCPVQTSMGESRRRDGDGMGSDTGMGWGQT